MLEQSTSEVSDSISKKIGTSLILGVVFSALLLMLGNGGNIPFLPPALIFPLVALTLLGAVVFPLIWHYLEKREKINSEKVYGFLYSGIRYVIAFNIASFGWKKFYGLQFVVPAEIARLPMNQQSGEWLTWFYFGHSHTFGIIIAVIQIAGGYLLLFRRTLLIGSIILFALLSNLTLINIFYQMNAGALMQSVVLTIGVLFLILLDYKKLIVFFLKTKSNLPSLNFNNGFAKNSIRISAIVLSLLYTIYIRSLVK
ncbi:hypothetical protein [Flavobacterium aquicola]|uniref:Uncharacterized protein n=1 Tax=Flavobacterium aquicola TaxID=1682742 RepID=A0A3E0EH11_9FLAO|nr:hypothetical protein [Flavobacterium aquicola]REG96306.1 hypothetical protein C8P67_110132 [Flavobacterium aquicola]